MIISIQAVQEDRLVDMTIQDSEELQGNHFLNFDNTDIQGVEGKVSDKECR